MRQFRRIVSVVAAVLLGIVVWPAQPVMIAQEATPTSDEVMSVEGITFIEPVAIVEGVTAPDPTDLVVVRFGIDPGASLPADPNDPSGELLIVESGTLTLHLETPLTIMRGSLGAGPATTESGRAFTPATETIASGEEATLEAGDAVYAPGTVSGEIRNDGDEPATVLVMELGPVICCDKPHENPIPWR